MIFLGQRGEAVPLVHLGHPGGVTATPSGAFTRCLSFYGRNPTAHTLPRATEMEIHEIVAEFEGHISRLGARRKAGKLSMDEYKSTKKRARKHYRCE